MKMKQISDTTLKITISLNDLEERGMDLSDFLVPKEKTEEFFYTILEELDLPVQFRQSGMLSFRVTPKSDRVDIFVTKSDVDTGMNLSDLGDLPDVTQLSPEDFFKSLEESMTAQGDKEALERLRVAEIDAEVEELMAEHEQETEQDLDYVHYVLAFNQLSDVVNYAQTVDYPVEASEIYRYGDTYQMTVLISLEDKPENYSDLVYARMLEHAKASTKTRAYLREHAELLREGDVLQELAGLR